MMNYGTSLCDQLCRLVSISDCRPDKHLKHPSYLPTYDADEDLSVPLYGPGYGPVICEQEPLGYNHISTLFN